MPHSFLFVVASDDTKVSLVLSVATCFVSVPLRSTSRVSLPSELLRCFLSPQVRQPLRHLHLVPAAAQDQGVKWEAWGPSIREVPWSSAQGQLQAPSGVPLQGPSP